MSTTEGYRRAARHALELHLGDLGPLDEAIPELTPQAWGESEVSQKSVEAAIAGVPSGIRTRLKPYNTRDFQRQYGSWDTFQGGR